MIHKTKSAIPGHVRIVFELPSCIWADRIFVTGDFSDWRQSQFIMRQDRDGAWRAAVDLPSGQRFEFRYVVDGQWRTDYHADGCTTNPYGTQNSVVFTGFADECETAEAERSAPAFGGKVD